MRKLILSSLFPTSKTSSERWKNLSRWESFRLGRWDGFSIPVTTYCRQRRKWISSSRKDYNRNINLEFIEFFPHFYHSVCFEIGKNKDKLKLCRLLGVMEILEGKQCSCFWLSISKSSFQRLFLSFPNAFFPSSGSRHFVYLITIRFIYSQQRNGTDWFQLFFVFPNTVVGNIY